MPDDIHTVLNTVEDNLNKGFIENEESQFIGNINEAPENYKKPVEADYIIQDYSTISKTLKDNGNYENEEKYVQHIYRR
ncbi:hypothetical protein TSAR_007087 [Trichomalopsis sarcophagae]|uniref:Uncharacterized protein n=1 Tax=Trichomalopsis sarcophagae TaxID=543379 RepID=A0A232ERY3_9HYME|nr:hypothetical protein TSAR_007087 [Trichomalopsis sarcophagae]